MGVNPLPLLYHTPLYIHSTYYLNISLSTYLRSTLRLRWVTLGDPFLILLSAPSATSFCSSYLLPLHTVRSSYPILLHTRAK